MFLNPYVWGGILLALALAGGTGFMKGISWEQGRAAIKELNRKDAVIKATDIVYKKDNSTVAAHEQEKAGLHDEINGLRREYDRLRGELDKRAGVCDLPAPVLGVLNRARTGLGSPADSGKSQADVRSAPAPPAR